jgi:anti-sigma B factor antagonist
MFDMQLGERGEIVLTGRWDSAQTERAERVFGSVNDSIVVDFRNLDYISSAGLGVLIETQKRLTSGGEGLKLVNLNSYITDVFRYSGLDRIFGV